ncbi:hypothetical protein CesoFtcFv8_004179 [Champsocephalus esox]|uniref:Uncharacterized protein n=1 Tax=Champsocephalus esox TaxID=159716 RepID=A0AAN8CY31_9TELE|nr:hypothetical protein CesoFtcFv8_004179 [Champsocephalus esox]
MNSQSHASQGLITVFARRALNASSLPPSKPRLVSLGGTEGLSDGRTTAHQQKKHHVKRRYKERDRKEDLRTYLSLHHRVSVSKGSAESEWTERERSSLTHGAANVTLSEPNSQGLCHCL